MDKSLGGNLPRIKIQNQFAIKEVIYKFGPISRIEIAQRLGLTLPTITTSVSMMLKKGFLKEVESSCSVKALGRKTMLVDINEKYGYFLGIEVRGTFRRAMITDMRGNEVYSLSDETPNKDYRNTIESAGMLALSLVDKACLHFDDILSIGLTTPGIVNKKDGILVMHPGYKWADKKIRDDFASITGYKGDIIVDNNTISRGYALSMFQGKNLKDADSLAYMYISSGIGCPLFSGVNSHFGIVTGDGEVGHMVMNPNGPVCACGNTGCLEAYSSEKAMLERAEESHSQFYLDKKLSGNPLTMDDILEGAKSGDKDSISIVDESIKYLGLAIANIDNFVRPECVVVEGGLFSEVENRKKLLEVIHINLYNATKSDYRFVFLPPDIYSGAKGAVAVAIKHTLEAFFE